MNFSHLCNILDSIRQTKGLSQKSKEMKTFFQTIRQQEELYPIVRLVVPKFDRERPSYRIKESKISKLLIKMLGLPQGNDRNLILNSVSSNSIQFGDIIYSVLKKFVINKDVGLTVLDINNYLDKIATRTTDSGLDDLILEIFRKLSPTSIKWLIQIILKDLKIGLSDNSILNCIHEDGAAYYATSNNLQKLCEVLSNPKMKLVELEIQIFEAFRPMLSKRCDASNFKKCFPDSKSFIIENKFDGERFQLHMQDGKFKYFSRNGFDFTNSYGASYTDGSFTPLLTHVFAETTNRVILDGEMMLWNKRTKSFGSKGMKLDVKKLKDQKLLHYQPCFCVFDILLYNDKILTNQPLIKRLQLLREVIKNPITGVIIISDYLRGDSRSDIVNSLNTAVDNNEEGIVVKDPKSIYKCNDRNSGWFKIKMEFFDDVVHDLDVLLMGGFYGANNKLNSFMVGVSSGKDTYFSFGSLSSGLNNEQLDILNEKFKTYGIDYKDFPRRTKGKLFFGRETPDVYIEPNNSYILQVRATELIRTTNDHVKCPYTLRFPRVLSIRDDKPVDECLSMNELLELTSQNKSVIKLNKRHIELDEISKSRVCKKIKYEVISFGGSEGDFLSNKRFYVDSGSEKWTTEEILHSIKKAGGEITYRLDGIIDILLIGRITPKILNLMKNSNQFDIIHVDWFRRVLDEKRLVNYNQDEIFYLGCNFHRDISTDLDKYGDSFIEEINKESLDKVFGMIHKSGDFLNTNKALVINNDKNCFGEYTAYFDSYKEINNDNSSKIYDSFLDQIEFEFHGGTVSAELTGNVDFVIIEQDCVKRTTIINDFLTRNGLGPIQIYNRNFIFDQISSQN